MEQFDGISLKTRLYLLVLAAFIPVTMLIFYVTEEQKAIEKDAILHRTKLLVQAAANAENLQIEATRELMTALTGAFLMASNAIWRSSALEKPISMYVRPSPTLGSTKKNVANWVFDSISLA